MQKQWIGLSLLSMAAVGLFNGCLSNTFSRSAGGEYVWWCDVTQSRVGNKDTHIPGMTKFDPKTGKDVPMEGISQDEVQEVLTERQQETVASGQQSVAPQPKKSLIPWRKEQTPEPEPAYKSHPIPTPEVKEEKKSLFTRSQPEKAEEEVKPLVPEEPTPNESAPKKRSWKFWR